MEKDDYLEWAIPAGVLLCIAAAYLIEKASAHLSTFRDFQLAGADLEQELSGLVEESQ